MNLVLHIPDDFAERLSSAGDVERQALEGLALESYRLGRVSKAELRRLLGLERLEVDGFLKAHDVYDPDPITIEEIDRQVRDVERLGL
jgi:hypothetical protein